MFLARIESKVVDEYTEDKVLGGRLRKGPSPFDPLIALRKEVWWNFLLVWCRTVGHT